MSETRLLDTNTKSRWISPNWTSWSRFSENMLRTLEKKILQIVKTAYRGFYVDIGPVVSASDKVWTIAFNTEASTTPLVLLHGLGAGVALWCPNLDSLAANRPVYAIDILGFGRSSRPTFSSDALEAEKQFVRSIEEWRHEMKLDKFVLLGHSMGGYLATSYALTYPDRVKHLILADPWGFPERPPDSKKKEIPLYIKAIVFVLQPFNPLAGVRAAGPLGPWIINALRPDISRKYADLLHDQTLIPQYIHQCNAQTPSGESAFRSMMHSFGWAKNPMVNRIHEMHEDVPITLVYGSKSWVDHSASEIVKEKRIGSYVKVQVIQGAGHHVYADKPSIFNTYVNEACLLADSSQKLAIMPAPNTKTENAEDKGQAIETKADTKPEHSDGEKVIPVTPQEIH